MTDVPAPDAPLFVIVDSGPDSELTARMVTAVGCRALVTTGIQQALLALQNTAACGVVLDCSPQATDPEDAVRRLVAAHPLLSVIAVGETKDPRLHGVFAAGASEFVAFPATGRELGPIVERLAEECRAGTQG